MSKLIALAAALIASAVCLEVAFYLARHLGPWVQDHMGASWFVLACNVFIALCLGVFALRRKPAVNEDKA